MIGETAPLDALPRAADDVLQRFGLTAGHVLGWGSESVVFRLDAARVVRIPRGKPSPFADLGRRQAFMADIDGRLPFQTPRILEIGEGSAYTIETLLPGRPMSTAMAEASGGNREQMWSAYVDAVEAISKVERPEPYYGHLLASEPIRTATWTEFVAASMRSAADRNRAAIAREVGPPGELLDIALSLTDDLETEPPRVLVHGDAFPGNFLMDDKGNITALLDFSFFTVAGDARLDLASSYLALEMIEESRPGDAEFVLAIVRDRHGEDILPALRCYRAWFALFMADPANASAPYPRLYDWSLANLRRLAQAGDGGFGDPSREA